MRHLVLSGRVLLTVTLMFPGDVLVSLLTVAVLPRVASFPID